jgi:hypothetical protein
MPNTELPATASGAHTDWNLIIGANKWVAVNKPDDDANTYIQTAAAPAPKESYTFADLNILAAIIVSVNLDSSGMRAGASDLGRFRAFWLYDGSFTYSDYHQPGAAWTDYQDDDMARPGGGNWSRAIINASEYGVEHNLNGGTGMNVTTLAGNVDWLPGGAGSYKWLIQSWVSPLLPFIGGAVDVVRELGPYFAQLQTKPSTEEDFRRIQEWLQRRRTTLDLLSLPDAA